MRHPWTTAFILSVLVILAVPASAQPAPGKRPVRVPLATPEQQAPLEAGIDRYGSDYRSVELAEPKPELCRDECLKDARCLAFTFVRPGAQGERAVCWLKDAVPDRTSNADCVSGVVAGRGPAAELTTEPATDRHGGDYRSVELAEPKPELCRDECGRDERCKAYTYVKPGVQGDAPVCWLKDAVPEPSPNEDCVSGVKKKRERKGR